MWVRVGREQYHGTVTAPLCLELQWGRVQPQENQLRVGTALYTSCPCNHRTKKEEYQLIPMVLYQWMVSWDLPIPAELRSSLRMPGWPMVLAPWEEQT